MLFKRDSSFFFFFSIEHAKLFRCVLLNHIRRSRPITTVVDVVASTTTAATAAGVAASHRRRGNEEDPLEKEDKTAADPHGQVRVTGLTAEAVKLKYSGPLGRLLPVMISSWSTATRLRPSMTVTKAAQNTLAAMYAAKRRLTREVCGGETAGGVAAAWRAAAMPNSPARMKGIPAQVSLPILLR